MTGRILRNAWTQGAFLALALLALVVRVGVPPGFMADPAGGAGLVLCTGSGPVSDSSGKTPANSNPDSPCAFAGHAAVSEPPAAPLLPTAILWREAPPLAAAQPDQIPGRGLAAPPPPSVGPPLLT